MPHQGSWNPHWKAPGGAEYPLGGGFQEEQTHTDNIIRLGTYSQSSIKNDSGSPVEAARLTWLEQSTLSGEASKEKNKCMQQVDNIKAGASSHLAETTSAWLRVPAG